MQKIIITILLIVIINSCSKKSALQEEFICETESFSNTEVVTDFQNKFSITTPKHWKTQLYFDTVQTQIISADTTKNFTNTYTINIEYNSGNLEINEKFKSKVITELEKTQITLKNKTATFKDKPSFWVISKGKKKQYDYYLFQLFVAYKATNYFKITSEVYGDTNIDERFCESIAIIETLEFLD